MPPSPGTAAGPRLPRLTPTAMASCGLGGVDADEPDGPDLCRHRADTADTADARRNRELAGRLGASPATLTPG